MSATPAPKKYITGEDGSLILNPLYKSWKNNGGRVSITDPIPVAVATASIPDASNIPYAQEVVAEPFTESDRVKIPQNRVTKLSRETKRQLRDEGYTEGLMEALVRNNQVFPLRIWVVDNSGSMMANDGHRLVKTAQRNEIRYLDCTRWAEIQETVEYHAQIAAMLEAPTVFRMLNNPGAAAGPQQFSIGERGPDFISSDLATALNTIRMASPGGVTPLTQHVKEIRANVLAMESMLVQAGQKAVIVLATDGLPSDNRGRSDTRTLNEFRNSIRSLEGLPVWVVVRLCTDEERVVDFYNDLDSHLELSLEVIDDYEGEAKEVYEFNKWLNYAMPLQRMREMGFSDKLFDLLDERRLTKGELRQFMILIFGIDKCARLPDPQIDWSGFISFVNQLANGERQQWNPVKRKIMPWIDVKKMHKMYGQGEQCTIM